MRTCYCFARLLASKRPRCLVHLHMSPLSPLPRRETSWTWWRRSGGGRHLQQQAQDDTDVMMEPVGAYGMEPRIPSGRFGPSVNRWCLFFIVFIEQTCSIFNRFLSNRHMFLRLKYSAQLFVNSINAGELALCTTEHPLPRPEVRSLLIRMHIDGSCWSNQVIYICPTRGRFI